MRGISDGAAGRREAEKELNKILDSDVFAGGSGFKKVEKLASLLTFIVTETLDGKEVTENVLLLDHYKYRPSEIGPHIPTARANVSRLRKKLASYYATAGLDDNWRIDIPVGQYLAQFTPNPKSPAQKEVKLGYYHVDLESPNHLAQALFHFENAISIEPHKADGYAGKASALLTMTLHAYSDDPTDLFIQADMAARTARNFDDGCWQAHVNVGAVHLFRHEWELADSCFGRARELSPFDIDTLGGYGLYLLSRGKHEEGLALAHRYLDEGFDDSVLLVRAGLYLYALRYFKEAEEALQSALRLTPHFWRAHMVMALVCLSTNKPEQALSHMLQVEPLSKENLWPGLRILCLEAVGRSADAEAEFLRLEQRSEERYIQPMQLALGHMALGDFEKAITFMSLACDEADPFTAWLHLWPFLDPLRRFPEFRALLRQRRFPSA